MTDTQELEDNMATAMSYERQGKLVYNYVTAGYPDGIGRTVIVDGRGIKVDDDEPITLQRCKRLHIRLCELTGQALGSIKVNLSAFEIGEYDGANPQIWGKTYAYDPRTNSLVIYDQHGTPVYANDDGVVTKDQVALIDSLAG